MRNMVKHAPSYLVGYIAGVLDVLLYSSIMWVGYVAWTYIL